MKYCVKCGRQLNDTDIYCAKCGSKQNDENIHSENQSNNVTKTNVKQDSQIAYFSSAKTQEALYKRNQTFFTLMFTIPFFVWLLFNFVQMTTDNFRLAYYLESQALFVTLFCGVFIITGLILSYLIDKKS